MATQTIQDAARAGHAQPESHVYPSASERSLAGRLEGDLRRHVRGEVRFDAGSRALYSTDASNYRQIPIGVVVPRDVDDMVATVAACRRHGAPVLARGGGTSLAGQCCNVAVVMDCSKYVNKIVEINAEGKYARVQPGLVLDDLRHAAERHHLTFGPDPATHNHNTLGGMLGNNSCGVHSVMAGETSANVDELEVLTYDGLRLRVGATGDDELERIVREGGRRGAIYRALRDLRDRYADEIRARFPDIPRRVSGYALDQLLPEKGFNVARALVGTECTCVTILEARLRLVHSPPSRVLLVLGYRDISHAGDAVPRVMEQGPIGLEGLGEPLVEFLHRKHMLLDNVRLFPQGGGWLLAEFGAETPKGAEDAAQRAMAALGTGDDAPHMALFTDPAQQEKLWKVRESGLGATSDVPGMRPTWPGWEDSSVRPDQLGKYLRDFRALLDKHHYDAALYGHFGQGCLHCRIDFDLETPRGISDWKVFLNSAADLVVKYGGSLSGEHGDGQARAELLPRMYGDTLVRAFEEFKAIWDPDGKMNPGKVVRPYRVDQNLRLGTEYDPPNPKTYFQFPDDQYDFARAALRCVGVGECRKHGDGIMCPSYMATREEEHSTRGRARLLFEMLEGQPLEQGWKSDAVKGALHLCLACKGCKGECPVRTDMATYKAEFLAHYYEGRLRPRSAYAFGLIMYWAQLAARAPGLVNFFSQTPGFRGIAKALTGMAPERRVPRFAGQTFQAWFRERGGSRGTGARRVILWPDTFNNHFHPHTAQAAVEVLEAAGWRVDVPQGFLCCGRPFYDYGMLGLARKHLRGIIDLLRDDIRAGVPIVGLEPSCVSVFRDELPNMEPHDADARRLSVQVFTLSEFLQRHAPDFQIPRLDRTAILQGHCHQKSVLDMDSERDILKQMGLDYSEPQDTCCGMAGSFGFEQGDRYRVAVTLGERALLPAVRGAKGETLIVADGFSCREQIAQGSRRQGLHLAEVLQLALREGRAPHRDGQRADEDAGSPLPELALLAAGSALAGGALIWRLARRR